MAKIKSVEHAPKVADSQVQLAINSIYNEINRIIDAVNSNVTDAEQQGSGRPGDIRVTNKSDNTVVLEVSTNDGWFETSGLTMIKKRG